MKMDDIPMEARIVAVADVYDALSNRRAYKQAWGEEEICAEMLKEVAVGRLDGECVNALLSAREARADIHHRLRDDEP